MLVDDFVVRLLTELCDASLVICKKVDSVSNI